MDRTTSLHRNGRDELLLKGFCQKIIKGIDEPSPNSEQRAIWELVQNARDLSKDCRIAIRLYPDRIEFAHQGEPFDDNSLFALVIQNSSKDDEDKEQAGQYGTGFMTTHVFNTIVRIDGTFDVKNENGEHRYYVPLDDFELDRSGKFVNELMGKMMDAIGRIDALENLQPIPERRTWTQFTYGLNERMAAILCKQLEDAKRLIPMVLVINERIQEIRIQNVIPGYESDCRFAKEEGETWKEESGRWKEQEYTIAIQENEGKPHPVVCRTIQTENGQDIVFIPPFDLSMGEVDALPSLYVWFPLLGTEQFGVNFAFHSERFFPVEKRNCILLPQENCQNPEKYEANECVLNEMFEALFAYYANPEHAHALPIACSRVHFPRLGAEDDQELKRFYDGLQKKWVEAIRGWQIIPTEGNGYAAMNNRKVRVLAPEFYEGLDAEQQQLYEPVMRRFASMVKVGDGSEDKIILPSENLIQWSKNVAEWDRKAEGTFVTLQEVCAAILTKTDELHQFLEWLKEIKQENLFDAYRLIPNREGELRYKRDLQDGKTIPEALYRVARPIIGTKLDVLVDEAYADIFELTEYKRGDLRGQVSAALQEWKCEKVEDLAAIPIADVIRYCSAYSTDNPNSLRSRMMPIISTIFGCAYEQITIPNEPTKGDERAAELYDTCFDYLTEYTMVHLSAQKPEWLAENGQRTEHYDWLWQFVSEYTKTIESNIGHLTILKQYALFPNQRYGLCKIEELKRNSSVEPEFAKLYDEIMGEKIEETWVMDDFSELVKFEEQNPKDLGKAIEDKVQPYLNDKRANEEGFEVDEDLEKQMQTVVYQLGNKHWLEYFDHFAQESMIQMIAYELGSKEQKEALYKIKTGVSDQATLNRLAALAGHPNINAILSKAEEAVKLLEEQKRQFTITHEMGKSIEREVGSKISQDLVVDYSKTIDEFVTKDEQNGQDIVIRKNGEPVFYIECKAKWNFSIEKAHMSSQQMKQAVRHKGEYALLCVDCTPDTGCKVPFIATKEEVHEKIDDIIAHTYVHLEIGEQLAPIIGTEVLHEDAKVDEESAIKLYSSLSCNIPKKVFVNGISFGEFMERLQTKLSSMVGC